MNASVAKWLERLVAEPVRAVDDLVMGRVAIPVWSRASLGEVFLDIVEVQAEALDVGVAEWLENHLGKLPPDGFSNEVWGAYLQDLFRAMTSLSLPRVARLMGTRRREFQAWLRPLVREASLDPEAAYLTALAWCEHNRHLEGFWRNLALRDRNEPEYYTDIGLLGLRKPRDDAGQLPPKAPLLLLATLLDMADSEKMTQPVWERKTRTVMAGYRPVTREVWIREFNAVLTERPAADCGMSWLQHLLAIPAAKVETPPRHQGSTKAPTLDECGRFVDTVGRYGPSFEAAKLEDFLKRHRDFAARTNNPHYLVRTYNRLAVAAKEHDPDWAVARIEEALAWEPGNAKNWTVLAGCHWARRHAALQQQRMEHARIAESQACEVLWEGRCRFPYDPYFRNSLADFYKNVGELQTAEDLYREAFAAFPRSPVPRCGLADVKHLKGDVVEAERLYRETITKFPDDAYAHTCLAKILFQRSRISRDEAERDEARSHFQTATRLGNTWAIDFLNNRFDKEWQKTGPRKSKSRQESEAASTVDQLLSQNEADMGPAQRLGRALLAMSQAAHCTRDEDRQPYLDRAASLLSLPDALTGEFYRAFLESRGFLLLARGQNAEARDYFLRQLELAEPHRPAGLELGLSEARHALHESSEPESVPQLPAGRLKSLLLPLVLQVVEWSQTHDQDDLLRETLLAMFPSVKEKLAKSQPLDEDDETPREESPDTMLAGFLQSRVFQLAGIETEDDLRDPGKLQGIKNALRLCEPDLRSMAHSLVLAV